MPTKRDNLRQIVHDLAVAQQAVVSLGSMLAEAADLADIGVSGPGLAALLEGIRSRLEMGTSGVIDLAEQLGMHEVAYREAARHGIA